MATRFVNVDRRTAMLLPPDMRDWVLQDDMVHFVINAVEVLGFRQFHLRELKKVETEWQLVCVSDNLKRLFHHLGADWAAKMG